MPMTSFERFSVRVTHFVGHCWTFLAAVAVIVIWLVSGPACGWSDTWQLWINTSTTIVTFLMVFVIQQSQNRDALKTELKLDELVAAMKGASTQVIKVEDLSEPELRALLRKFEQLPADRLSRSIEEATVDDCQSGQLLHAVRSEPGGASEERGQGGGGSHPVEG